MKKELCLFLAVIINLTTLVCCAQDPSGTLPLQAYSSYTSNALPTDLKVTANDTNYDQIVLKSIARAGLSGIDIELATTDEFGAYSAIHRISHERYIVYGKAFFDAVRAASSNDYPLMSICFHELGHLLYNHPLKASDASLLFEREADRYSGFQMCLAGATLPESLTAITGFGNTEPTETHPGKEERIQQITQGYREARIMLYGDPSSLEADSAFKMEEVTSAVKSAPDKKISLDKIVAFDKIKVRHKYKDMYNLLGELIYESGNNIRTFSDDKTIGRISTLGKEKTITVEGVKYKVGDDGKISSSAKAGPQMSVGYAIN